jgi:small subunit ribosomal protein S8
MDRNLIIDIKNGFALKKKIIEHKKPNTNTKQNILNLFLKVGIISGFRKVEKSSIKQEHLEIILKYDSYGNKVFRELKISSQKNRNYSVSQVKKLLIKNNFNQYIFATDLGLLTGTQAINNNVGGKLLYILNH